MPHTTHWMARPLQAAVISLTALLVTASSQAQPTGLDLLDRTISLVEEHFYNAEAADRFHDIALEVAATMPERPNQQEEIAAIRTALAALGASHTGLFTADQLDYYELLDVFQSNYRQRLTALYPPRGEIRFPSIGLVPTTVDGLVFAARIYDGGPADFAGVRVGDELVTINGQPFAVGPILSSHDRETVEIGVRRRPGDTIVTLDIAVQEVQPTEALLDAIRASAKVHEVAGFRIGTIRLWTFHDARVEAILADILSGGPLADIDGLVLDLRGRWGGAPADAAEMFLGGTPTTVTVDQAGVERYASFRWRGPLVAVIDGGSRSGIEILAYALKERGVPLVGETTAGALLAGRGFLLEEGVLLELAVMDVLLGDAVRLEGNGVEPTVPVPFERPYADGADPQLDEALGIMVDRLRQSIESSADASMGSYTMSREPDDGSNTTLT